LRIKGRKEHQTRAIGAEQSCKPLAKQGQLKDAGVWAQSGDHGYEMQKKVLLWTWREKDMRKIRHKRVEEAL
jgi:hypothetical protein